MSLNEHKYQKFDLHAEGMDDFILDYVAHYTVPEKRRAKIIFQELETKIQRREKLRKLYQASSLAAACLIIYFGLSIFFDPAQTYETLQGETLQVSLPDGSSVHLNEKSQLDFRHKGWEETRIVKLRGEAFFDVKKGSSFKVDTKDNEITVLGTSFTVVARDDLFAMNCYTGKVKVLGKESQQVVIGTPGIEARVVAGNLQLTPFDLSNAPKWMKYVFNFKELPLRDVFLAIENHFDIKIKHTTLPDIYFTGEIHSGKLKDILDILSTSMGFTYIKNNNNVQVKF